MHFRNSADPNVPAPEIEAMNHAAAPKLGWLSIVRLGLVQTALGGIVVLTTSTINRVMVVELALPAILPGLLVALHFSVQLLRPRWGHNSDQGGRSTPWILAGMATLAAGGFLAAVGTAWMSVNVTAGIMLAVLAFLLIGLGAGAAGTSLLVLLAKRVAPERRAAAATIVWVMMIAGFVVTAGTAGHFLDPFSYKRLVTVAASVSAIAFAVAVLAVWGIEGEAPAASGVAKPAAKSNFREALTQVWGEPEARHFTIFVFVSMLAYSAQDLILEPFAGEIFRYTPGASTKLSGVQHGGVLVGMILVAISGSLLPAKWRMPLKTWTIIGCAASAVSLGLIALSGAVKLPLSFSALVFLLGLSNGTFAISAIGSMMMLAGAGGPGREGVRMGLWGAAQAIAFGSGGLIGAASVDLMRFVAPTASAAYATVFFIEGLVFLWAAGLAVRIGNAAAAVEPPRATEIGRNMLQAAE
jgi:MFS transporter, BCD family, chlorophyll transporter